MVEASNGSGRSPRRRIWLWAGIALALAVLLAVILVAIAIILVITQSGGSSNTGPVNSGDVHGQIDGLKQLVQDNAQ